MDGKSAFKNRRLEITTSIINPPIFYVLQKIIWQIYSSQTYLTCVSSNKRFWTVKEKGYNVPLFYLHRGYASVYPHLFIHFFITKSGDVGELVKPVVWNATKHVRACFKSSNLFVSATLLITYKELREDREWRIKQIRNSHGYP